MQSRDYDAHIKRAHDHAGSYVSPQNIIQILYHLRQTQMPTFVQC